MRPRKLLSRSLIGLIGLCLLGAPLSARGGSSTVPVRIYLANDDHTDFLWTADAETYERVFQEMVDYYLDLADETETNPEPYQSRFNCDGSYWLWIYERHRTAREFQRVVARLRSGHLSAPMTTLVSCYGGQPLEAVLRGMYYAGRLERRYGLRFRMAVAMENQTLPLGLASLWAGAGARYSWRGVCDCASRLSSGPLHQRPHEIYWYSGLDGQRLLMKWHSLAPGGNRQLGGYAEAFDPVLSIRYLSTDADFFRDFEELYGESLPCVSVTYGNEWDLYSAMRSALEHQNPLMTGSVEGKPEGPYPGTRYSLITVDRPSVLLWACKPHEDGIDRGVIARVWNLSATAQSCTLSFAPGLAAAHLVTHVETDIRPLPVSSNRVTVETAPGQLQSARLLLRRP